MKLIRNEKEFSEYEKSKLNHFSFYEIYFKDSHMDYDKRRVFNPDSYPFVIFHFDTKNADGETGLFSVVYLDDFITIKY